ncbi:class I SAM-dependent methyltransferase [Halomonas sp. QX-2]|uniref:Class I SAM-dependent methyltransferase n=1 Tax=Vreelandella sedimenti TaxID=2729618 RepID=A0A7Z0NB85_9GAMM|nr:class I SAM-dependent methyltransferase [Halomonas sedimenti]NYT74326.1 class I SAM-dependent methyltransferase [Halomonas sedimenti]
MNQSHTLTVDKTWLFEPRYITEPDSWAGHTPFAAWLVSNQKPDRLVELGTHTGFSYGTFCQAVSENALPTQCFAVDTWQGDEHAGNYDDTIYQQVKEWHDERYSGFSRLMRMTFDDALAHFEMKSVDLLHIDGLHTYEAVKHDFDTWLPKLSDRAVVLFHDTHVRDRGFAVWQLWDELTKQYPHITFAHSSGLGVLLVGKDVAPSVKQLANTYQHSPELVSGMFAQLGGRIENLCEMRRQRHQNEARGRALEEREEMLVLRDNAIVTLEKTVREQQQALQQGRHLLTTAESTSHSPESISMPAESEAWQHSLLARIAKKLYSR